MGCFERLVAKIFCRGGIRVSRTTNIINVQLRSSKTALDWKDGTERLITNQKWEIDGAVKFYACAANPFPNS